MENNVVWCNPEFRKFSDIPHVQVSCIRKRLFSLQSAKVTAQLPMSTKETTKQNKEETIAG